ncbi:MAG: hypothetical protein AAGM38_09205 [Pseudomonadota bacterium]
MRLIMTVVVFIMASVVFAGAFVTVALAAPELELLELSKFGVLAGAGFLVALPFSYWVAGMILAATEPKG